MYAIRSYYDRTVAQSARARKLDVVGAQDLEHLRAHQALDQGHLEQAERYRGQSYNFV